MITRLALSAILSALLSCGRAASDHPRIYAKWEGGEARVVVRSIRDAAQLGIDGVVIYGDVLVFKASCAEREAPSWKPTRQLITSIESSLILPEDTYALSSYVRYYAGEVADQKRLVRGVFLYQKTFGKVEIVESGRLPHVLDGGCSVVNLLYSIDERRVISISCQGAG